MTEAGFNLRNGILLIDIGNTNLKWTWLLGDDLSPLQSRAYRNRSMKEVASDCWRGRQAPVRVLVASVGDKDFAAELAVWVREVWGAKAEFIRSPSRALGVTNAYAEPAQLGVDRWLTLIAVFNNKQAPACIVDCGTAVTLDVIDRGGQHLGGLILPGFRMMREALLQGTNIPRHQAVADTGLFARDTASAVAAGSIQATAALIDRVLHESNRRLGERPKLILTGSDAAYLQSVLAEPCDNVPELVMSGLALLAREQPA